MCSVCKQKHKKFVCIHLFTNVCRQNQEEGKLDAKVQCSYLGRNFLLKMRQGLLILTHTNFGPFYDQFFFCKKKGTNGVKDIYKMRFRWKERRRINIKSIFQAKVQLLCA